MTSVVTTADIRSPWDPKSYLAAKPGGKVHITRTGAYRAGCGTWLPPDGPYVAVDSAPISALCGRCFLPGDLAFPKETA